MASAKRRRDVSQIYYTIFSFCTFLIWVSSKSISQGNKNDRKYRGHRKRKKIELYEPEDVGSAHTEIIHNIQQEFLKRPPVNEKDYYYTLSLQLRSSICDADDLACNSRIVKELIRLEPDSSINATLPSHFDEIVSTSINELLGNAKFIARNLFSDTVEESLYELHRASEALRIHSGVTNEHHRHVGRIAYSVGLESAKQWIEVLKEKNNPFFVARRRIQNVPYDWSNFDSSQNYSAYQNYQNPNGGYPSGYQNYNGGQPGGYQYHNGGQPGGYQHHNGGQPGGYQYHNGGQPNGFYDPYPSGMNNQNSGDDFYSSFLSSAGLPTGMLDNMSQKEVEDSFEVVLRADVMGAVNGALQSMFDFSVDGKTLMKSSIEQASISSLKSFTINFMGFGLTSQGIGNLIGGVTSGSGGASAASNTVSGILNSVSGNGAPGAGMNGGGGSYGGGNGGGGGGLVGGILNGMMQNGAAGNNLINGINAQVNNIMNGNPNVVNECDFPQSYWCENNDTNGGGIGNVVGGIANGVGGIGSGVGGIGNAVGNYVPSNNINTYDLGTDDVMQGLYYDDDFDDCLFPGAPSYCDGVDSMSENQYGSINVVDDPWTDPCLTPNNPLCDDINEEGSNFNNGSGQNNPTNNDVGYGTYSNGNTVNNQIDCVRFPNSRFCNDHKDTNQLEGDDNTFGNNEDIVEVEAINENNYNSNQYSSNINHSAGVSNNSDSSSNINNNESSNSGISAINNIVDNNNVVHSEGEKSSLDYIDNSGKENASWDDDYDGYANVQTGPVLPIGGGSGSAGAAIANVVEIASSTEAKPIETGSKVLCRFSNNPRCANINNNKNP